VREHIFDVGHHDAVKVKLKELLTSEMVLVSEMHHEGVVVGRTIDDEGRIKAVNSETVHAN
jgi:hypothetical protein